MTREQIDTEIANPYRIWMVFWSWMENRRLRGELCFQFSRKVESRINFRERLNRQESRMSA